MKKLIIHAGTFKTGSTSLQRFFFDNERLLEEKGLGVFRPKWKSYHIPDTPPCNTLAHTATFLLNHFAIENGNYRKCNVSLQEKILESDAHNMQDFELFVQKHDIIVISSEGWSSEPKQYWDFVRKYAIELGFEQIQVVVYLRRQDIYLSSRYRQRIKGRSSVEFISEALVRKSHPFDYDACLLDIEAALGHESVTVRRYDRKRLLGGDVRRDFCDAIGISWDERFILQDNVNPSISFDVAEVKRLANLSPSYRDSGNFMSVACEQASKVVPDRHNESLLSSEEARSTMALYEEGNRAISERFFDGKPLFDEVEDGIIGWERDTDRVLDASIVLLTEALAEQRKQLAKQRQQLERLERLLLIPHLRKVKRLLNRLPSKR